MSHIASNLPSAPISLQCCCIMAIRRFIFRKGNTLEIHSDSGTNFKGAAADLTKAIEELDQEKLGDECSTKVIQWHFIPPHAPHTESCWERLVRSVKVALSAVKKEISPKEEVLQTLLIEVEEIVNSRPLNHVSLEDGSEETLTPNHFLIGRSSAKGPPGQFSADDMVLNKLWRRSQVLAD
jgi:transposase InsO family protein